VLGAFLVAPLLRTVAISFLDWNLVSPAKNFVGLANYRAVLGDDSFVPLLVQSAAYVVAALAGNVGVALALALLTLRVRGREADFYQSVIFLPTVVPVSIGALLFVWILLPGGGPLSAILQAFGRSSPTWLTDPHWALGCVALVSSWKFFGFNYLVILAGLRAIPRDVLEAAALDGASGGTALRRVVLPLLTPTLLFAALTTVLTALENAFVPVQILTLGGPSGASNNLIYAIFQDGFQFFQAGKASALSVVTLALFAGFAVWQFRMLERHVVYER
jgi:ABC-type sugar transport system permease subunit